MAATTEEAIAMPVDDAPADQATPVDPAPEDGAMDVDGVKAPQQEQDLTGDGGVVKIILQEGFGWETPDSGDKVSVHYVGTLHSDGSKFDSSRDRGDPFSFTLGQGQVIKGWDEGVRTMKKGEKAILRCRADYAYGDRGSPPKIPGGATLDFEVELLSWKSNNDLTGDGGVIKSVIKEGTGWDNPRQDDEVLVKYKVKVAGEDKVVAASGEDGVEFTLSAGHLLRGIPTAVRGMKGGEIAALKLSPAYGFGEEGSVEHGVPANASLEVELELVSWKPVQQITEDGLVMLKVTGKEDEDAWANPNEGAKVKLVYTARLQDGTVFDERGVGNELEFTTDEEMVLEGLERAVMKMKKGMRALITIGPKYGYGDQEFKAPLAVIPPNSTLIYEAHLVELEKAKESWEMTDEQKVETAAVYKEKGNHAYKAGRLELAVRRYSRAVDLIGSDKSFSEELKARCKDVKKSCWLNLAAVHLKQKSFKAALENCCKVLDVDSSNIKALYRRAQAYIGTADYVEAELDLKSALLADPQNTDVVALQKRLKVLQRAQNKKDGALYGRMFKALGAGGKTAAAKAGAGNGAQKDQPAEVKVGKENAEPVVGEVKAEAGAGDAVAPAAPST